MNDWRNSVCSSIALSSFLVNSSQEDNRSDATEHVLKIMVVHDASEEYPVDATII